MVASTGSPVLVFRRYFLSQMSSDAGWSGMSTLASRPVAGWVAGARAVLIFLLTSRCGLAAPVDFYWNATTSLVLQRRRLVGMAFQPACHRVSDNIDSPSRASRPAPVLVLTLAPEHKMLWLLPMREVNPAAAGSKVPRSGIGSMEPAGRGSVEPAPPSDRKSTRLNSSHHSISYAV